MAKRYKPRVPASERPEEVHRRWQERLDRSRKVLGTEEFGRPRESEPGSKKP